MNNHYDENIDIGVGLNQVDNLKPSSYFYQIIQEHSDYSELENKLQSYYDNAKKEINLREKECDIVSVRIAELLNETAFVFSPVSLLSIHKKLFSGVFDGKLKNCVGVFRDFNITKKENIINNHSVTYADKDNISAYLDYDFEREFNKDYSKLTTNEQIKNIAQFIANIWQIHPFAEGNTRTIALFSIKYLNKKGFIVDNSLFKEYSQYFRNALVLANYADIKSGIVENQSYLESFLIKLLIDNSHSLKELSNPYQKAIKQ